MKLLCLAVLFALAVVGQCFTLGLPISPVRFHNASEPIVKEIGNAMESELWRREPWLKRKFGFWGQIIWAKSQLHPRHVTRYDFYVIFVEEECWGSDTACLPVDKIFNPRTPIKLEVWFDVLDRRDPTNQVYFLDDNFRYAIRVQPNNSNG